jgi:hypothetical protein
MHGRSTNSDGLSHRAERRDGAVGDSLVGLGNGGSIDGRVQRSRHRRNNLAGCRVSGEIGLARSRDSIRHGAGGGVSQNNLSGSPLDDSWAGNGHSSSSTAIASGDNNGRSSILGDLICTTFATSVNESC